VRRGREEKAKSVPAFGVRRFIAAFVSSGVTYEAKNKSGDKAPHSK
jgi:hypothetical protein